MAAYLRTPRFASRARMAEECTLRLAVWHCSTSR
jgi:hypothetical protein